MIKQITITLFIASVCLISQYLFGWLVPLVLCFLFVGLLLDEHIVLTVTLIGTLINGIPTLYYFFMYENTANAITEDLSIILGNIDILMVLMISILIPTIMYSIAGVFAWQIAEIRRKLSV